MITLFMVTYNIVLWNKPKIVWLNLAQGEGVTVGLMGLIIDALIFIIVKLSLI